MAQRERPVKLVLNQQQLELIDATVARIGATDREDVVRIALREFFSRHDGPRPDEKA